jgi:hypothetical protein
LVKTGDLWERLRDWGLVVLIVALWISPLVLMLYLDLT